MSDLIERLRGPSPSIPAMRDAADEIERLHSECDDIDRDCVRLQTSLSRVAAERDEHARWRAKLADDLHDRETQIIELRRQLAEAEQESRRYRWLREHVDGDRWYLYYDDCGRDLLQGDALDAAIDAAMGLTRPAEE